MNTYDTFHISIINRWVIKYYTSLLSVIRCWGISGCWGWSVVRSRGWGWVWDWGMVWCWSWVRFWGVIWCWFWGMVWSWTMVRFLFWVADFAFVFNISVELFVFIYKVVYNSGSAIILHNLVLSFDDLSVTFFMSRVDIWSAIRIVVVDIISKNVWLRVMVRIFVVW